MQEKVERISNHHKHKTSEQRCSNLNISAMPIILQLLLHIDSTRSKTDKPALHDCSKTQMREQIYTDRNYTALQCVHTEFLRLQDLAIKSSLKN